MKRMALAIAQLATVLEKAAMSAKAVPQVSAKQQLTVEQAYAVQKASIARRIKRGEALVGVKVGFTSRAKAVQMGVFDLIWGRLTDAMLIADGATVDMARYVHPRIEPEIAFLLKKPLAGVVSNAEALSAVEAVAPAMELIDSRYENFKFSLTDVIADNSSSSGFVVGAWSTPDADLSNLGMVLEFDGRPVQIGSSAAILGHPLRSLVAAARLAADAGMTLKPGWIVMAGGATAAEALRPGVHVTNTVQHLGSVALTVAA